MNKFKKTCENCLYRRKHEQMSPEYDKCTKRARLSDFFTSEVDWGKCSRNRKHWVAIDEATEEASRTSMGHIKKAAITKMVHIKESLKNIKLKINWKG